MDIEKCFEILRVSSRSSSDEVKQAYRDLVNVWHPDRFSHNDRLRKKAEEEMQRINLAHQEILQFLSFEQERLKVKAEEEKRVRRETAIRARVKAEAEARMRQKAKAESYPEMDWESRILCGDGRCIGLINKDGRCTECGRTLEEARKEAGFWQKLRGKNGNATSDFSRQYDIPDPEGEPIDLENRTLCFDESCIGIMGPDGKCTECGGRLE